MVEGVAWGESSSEIFRDVTAGAGLEQRHHSGRSGDFYFVEMNGAGVALLDYDNDGDLDLFFPQGHGLPSAKPGDSADAPGGRLWRNQLTETGSLRFLDVTAQSRIEAKGYGMGVAVGDVDDDGFVDLYLTNFGPNQLWRNRGDGTFEDITAKADVDENRWSLPAIFFDYDLDGHLDLFVGNYVDFTLATHRTCPQPTGRADYCGPLSWQPQGDSLFRNLGNGRFEDVSRRSGIGALVGNGMGALCGDFDADGRPDLIVANDQMVNRLWHNQGDGTFADQGLLAGVAVNGEGRPEASMGIAAGDFDNDGDEDLFLSHIRQETNTLLRNNGAGLFEDVTAASGLGPPSWDFTGFGTGFLDYDNDGWLDVLVVNGAVRSIDSLVQARDAYPLHQRDHLYRNLGNGRFEQVGQATAAFTASAVSRGAAFGDLDNDGDTDVVIANNSGAARLLLNGVGQDRHWLGLRLLGGPGPRDMIGAWVEITRPEAPSLWRRLRMAGSYLSSSDPRILVGLGQDPRVGDVRVQWPDGTWERFVVAGVDRYQTLHRGKGSKIGASGAAAGEIPKAPSPAGERP